MAHRTVDLRELCRKKVLKGLGQSDIVEMTRAFEWEVSLLKSRKMNDIVSSALDRLKQSGQLKFDFLDLQYKDPTSARRHLQELVLYIRAIGIVKSHLKFIRSLKNIKALYTYEQAMVLPVLDNIFEEVASTKQAQCTSWMLSE